MNSSFSEILKKVFARFCEKTELQARVSLIIAVSVMVATFGSVCAATAAGRTVTPETPVDLMNVTSSSFAATETSGEITEPSETTSIETTGIADKYGALGLPAVDNELATLTDDELVDRITSGDAGVISRDDIHTDQSANNNNQHTSTVAAAPAPTNTPTPVPAAQETTAQTTIQSLNYEMGIDISQFQGDIDWTQVRAAGYTFAFIRCGGRGYGESGRLYTDTRFAENMKEAKAAGLKVGVYFFSQATTAYEALEEASLTISLIKSCGVTPNYPVVMDWETDSYYRTWNLSGTDFANVLTAYCSTIAQAGYTPMVYLNTSDVTSRLGSAGSSVLSNYKLWYALPYSNYQDGSSYVAGNAKPSKSFSFSVWQYSWWGTVPGISYPVDLDISFMGSTSLYTPVINLTNTSLSTPVGTVIDPMNGVTATNSVKATAYKSMITYAVYDSAGNSVTIEDACNAEGVYQIKYAYTDAYRGTVTATATLTVGNPVVETSAVTATTTAPSETSETVSASLPSESSASSETSETDATTAPTESSI
ncbi:MAG: glycoside hydrolase family 25 protein [Saccharofermentans sp.]|nr:glycoside hydrolase family 25 protein [Saccharofermentans sp.]